MLIMLVIIPPSPPPPPLFKFLYYHDIEKLNDMLYTFYPREASNRKIQFLLAFV